MTDKNLQQETLDVQEQQILAYRKSGGVKLGPWTSHLFYSDPKHLVFSLSRYKFASKLFDGYESVLEVGCGDSFGSVLVADNVKDYWGIDFDDFVIKDNQGRLSNVTNMNFSVHDILETPVQKRCNAAFSLDVIEHIPPHLENRFIANTVSSINNGPLLLGTPNIASSQFASAYSQLSHVNLKSAETRAEALRPFYRTVLSFSMNDEVVHTGFSGMAHYIFAFGIDRNR